ncbi:hypothetical protein BDF22DRAFT_304492 [Syncephalis plumigaleata]|nr:hypothetical protein BDF22DRAFT_304492 [Syncephalis plumigaleata]
MARLVYVITSWVLGAVRLETIRLPDTEVPLWGLTLTMALDLLEHTKVKVRHGRGWPRFDRRDLDFWQQLFGKFLNVRSGEADRSLARYYQALMLAILFTSINRALIGWIIVYNLKSYFPILRERLADALLTVVDL